MTGISIGGLASGLDTEALISGLMQIERAPRQRMQLREGQAQAREAALQGILARLEAASGAADALRSATLWADVQTVESADPARLSARRLSGAGPGGYQVEVTQLARAERRTYDFTASAAATQITVGAATVDLAAGATLADAVAAINAEPDTGVYAVDVGGRLVLSSRQTGAANGFAATGATIAEDPAEHRAGLDAAFTVDGVAGGSASNVVADAIPGIELTLKSVTGPVAVVVGAPGPDTEAATGALKTFVEKYNAAVDALRAELTEKAVPGATTQAEANRGVLFGDRLLSGLLGRMRQAVSESGVAGIGLSTGAPGSGIDASSAAVLGRLTLDEAKLGAALEDDPAAVRELLDGPDGLVARLDAVLAPSVGTGGAIDDRLDAVADEVRRVRDSMAALDLRLEAREDRLRAQFATLERLMSQSQSQAQWLTGQLAGLPGAGS